MIDEEMIEVNKHTSMRTARYKKSSKERIIFCLELRRQVEESEAEKV